MKKHRKLALRSATSILPSSYSREKASLKHHLMRLLPFCMSSARVRKPEKYSRPRCRFTFVSRGWWRRRFKARSACLANISKTKYKLTRRPFIVYTTPRSRGVEKAAARKVRLSLGAITFMHFFIIRSLRVISCNVFITQEGENIRSK